MLQWLLALGENAQGSLSKFFLELLSALAMPAWAIRNKTESVQFCLFFFGGGVTLPLGPES